MAELTADANFKAVFRNKNVAAKFIKLLIPELSRAENERLDNYRVIGEELSEDRIMTSEEAKRYVDDEIIYLPDSRRDEGYKEIVHDVLFSYKSDIIPTRNSTVTVDYEMENSRQSYPIAARGTYYAAKLHAQTIEKGASYNDSNKVYSIWLLNYRNWHDETAIRSIYQAMTFTDGGEVELRGENKSSKGYDRSSDGLEVIYVELPKIDRSKVSSELKSLLLSIRDGNDIMETIKDICGLNSKEAETMETNINKIETTINPYIEIGRLEGMQEGLLKGMQEGKLKGMHEGKLRVAIEMLKEGMPVELIAKITKLSSEEIKKYSE